MAYRDAAENRNLQRLEHLPGAAGCSRWHVTRLVDDEKEISLKNARFLPELRLKVGARVVLLTNTDEWVNGSTGEVISINSGSVSVRLDRGKTVSIEKAEEEILNGDGKAVCRVSQYPMMLGWSLTIHRAQGMTMDRVGVDLRGHFAPGQTYVALSRCKSSEGLFIVGNVDSVIADLETVALFGSGEGGNPRLDPSLGGAGEPQ
jgi:ATP-dependent exoDNAse (exonuclease V) alpha subunit